MKTIVFASSNTGKIKEVSEILSPLGFDIIPQSEFNVPDIEETGATFIENAILKARNCAKYTNLPALSDDSGLCVDALTGAPGIYSARYAKDESISNIDKLLRELQPYENKGAHFVSILCLMRSQDDPEPVIAKGILKGKITLERRGDKGFGYDPVFYLTQYQKTLAEISAHEKNKISHRALALNALKEELEHFSFNNSNCINS